MRKSDGDTTTEKEKAMSTNLSPTLEGCVNGVIAKSTNERGRSVFTFQCQHCGATETPDIPVLMTFKFDPFRDHEHGRLRLCPDCRMASYVGQGFTVAQIRTAKGEY